MTMKNAVAASIGVLVLCGMTARGLINPNFTPVNLTHESTLIAVLDIVKTEKPEVFTAKVQKALKGDAGKKDLTLDCSAAINKDTTDFIAKLICGAMGAPAVFCKGEYADPGAGGGGGTVEPTAKAFLHVGSKWVDLEETSPGVWGLIQMNSAMEATWAGGSDMLVRAIAYILGDEDAFIPVASGSQWDEVLQAASVGSEVNFIQTVDLDANGQHALFVAADAGDRLLAYDRAAKKVADVTARRKLASKSAFAAWGDFNGDGKLDLASSDGKTLKLVLAGAEGAFQPAAACEAGAQLTICLGLAAVDFERRGVPGLLVTTESFPLRVTGVAGEKVAVAPIATGDFGGKNLGRPAPCLVADFDGDTFFDVLQPFEKGSLFYKGQADGAFAAPVACPVTAGKGKSKLTLGDYDADGKLDVFVAGEEACCIWQNAGNGRFAEFISVSGEIAYISKPSAVDCATGDFNADGRQDILIAYADIGAQIFFNRGFRSFGHAHDLDLCENHLLDKAETGQRACCIADVNGDGAQDMVLALPGGDVWVFYRGSGEDALHVTAALAAKGKFGGPLAVTGWVGTQCLGAWNVVAGSSGAYFGLREAGPVKVCWQVPAGQPEKKEAVVESKPVRVEIK